MKVLSRLLVFGLLVGLGAPSFSQDAAIRPRPPVPYHIVYDSFFFRVMWFEKQADQYAAQGKDDSGLRSQIRLQARLTAAEEATLKNVARDYSVKNDVLLETMRTLAKGGMRPDLSPELRDLLSQREKNVLNHVAQLRSTLGPAQFKLLDMYVRRSSTVRPPVGEPAREMNQ
jgi:hypothetical protein